MADDDSGWMNAYIDACVEYVTIDPAYLDQNASTVEVVRVSTNAIRYILSGNERALGFVTEHESFNERVLKDVVAWAQLRIDDSSFNPGRVHIRERIHVLRERIEEYRNRNRMET